MKSTSNHTQTQAGFTLVELLLAMAFFGSVLMLATMLLMQVLNIYNKGMVVKQMNQVGRTLMEDMARVGNSGKKVTLGSVSGKVSCITIDDVTYIWNRASEGIEDEDGYAETSLYKDSSTKPINFVKISKAGTDCDTIKTETPDTLQTNDLSPVVGGTVRVYDMTVEKLADTNLVRVAMTLGTYDAPKSEYNLYKNGSNWECRPTGVGNFCAKANFETVLYVPNGELN